jgi:hypothetical protein
MATWIEIPGYLAFPSRPNFQTGAPGGFALVSLADANDKAGWIFQCPKAGELENFATWLGTVVTPEDLHVSFQNVSGTNGDPDGTEDQFRVIASGSLASNGWITSGRITDDGTDTGVRRTVAQGDLVAAVIRFNSFSAGNVNFQSLNLDGSTDAMTFPYASAFNTAWIKQSRPGSFAVQYSDGTYAQFIGRVYPVKALNATSFNSGSTPDERGLYFRLPFGAKVKGAWFKSNAASNQDHDVILYDQDGTSVLASISRDANQGTGSSVFGHYVTFTAEATLLANTFYRLVVKPTTANSLSIYDFDVETAALLDSIELGQSAYYTERTDAGAWTETTTKRPWMGLLISQILADSGAAPAVTSWMPGYASVGQIPDTMLPG